MFLESRCHFFSKYCKLINYTFNIINSLVFKKTNNNKPPPSELVYFLLLQILKRIQKYVSLEIT